MHTIRRALYALVLAATAFAPACAKEPKATDCLPVVREGWVRLVPGGMPMQAGFGRIENRCGNPATIVGAHSTMHDSAELHETKIVDGVSRMRAVPGLRIAPNDAAVLKPGGLHLMLMNPRTKLQAGTKIVVEFPLEDGRVVRGEFEVRAPN